VRADVGGLPRNRARGRRQRVEGVLKWKAAAAAPTIAKACTPTNAAIYGCSADVDNFANWSPTGVGSRGAIEIAGAAGIGGAFEIGGASCAGFTVCPFRGAVRVQS
jgi:hypothetical protein